jgi:hypothetical protein
VVGSPAFLCFNFLRKSKTGTKEMTNKIQFVVADENMFGMVYPGEPNILRILSNKVGAVATWQDGFCTLGEHNWRKATRDDFEVFRVVAEGYREDCMFEYPDS